MSEQTAELQRSVLELAGKMANIQGDVRTLINTCADRGRTNVVKLETLDKLIRGNGNSVGLRTRLAQIEQSIEAINARDTKKDKFAYTVIGVLITLLTVCASALTKHML